MKDFTISHGTIKTKYRWGTVILVCLLLMMPKMLFAQNSGIGFHAAPFLKISPAARQVSMGDAFSALTNDINVMRYNVG